MNKCQQEFENFKIRLYGMPSPSRLELNSDATDNQTYKDYFTQRDYEVWCAAWEAAQTQLITARNIYMLGYKRGAESVNK